MKEFVIKNLAELKLFARGLTDTLKAGDIVALSGKLGAGKTTLIQAVARFLGLAKSAQSPSFVIFKIYKVDHGSIKNLCHIDLYRLKNFDELHGFEEYLGDQDTVCFIEWAEKIKNRLPKRTIWVRIKVGEDGQRIITKNILP